MTPQWAPRKHRNLPLPRRGEDAANAAGEGTANGARHAPRLPVPRGRVILAKAGTYPLSTNAAGAGAKRSATAGPCAAADGVSAEFAAILLTIAFGFLSIASAIAFGLRNFSGLGPKLDNLSVKLDRVVENTAAGNAKIDTLIAVLPKQGR